MSEKDRRIVTSDARRRAAQRRGSRPLPSRPRAGAAPHPLHRQLRPPAERAWRWSSSCAKSGRCCAARTLHIIAGARHEQLSPSTPTSAQPGIELEGFVADVRPAYQRAAIVIAPLVASAGTNIKVLEAMAMGKALVSTPAGVNGLDLTPGEDFLLAHTAPEMAAAIEKLWNEPNSRAAIERAARARVERDYSWDNIAPVAVRPVSRSARLSSLQSGAVGQGSSNRSAWSSADGPYRAGTF